MISNGIWSDLHSETLWNAKYPHTPYQLWTSDPISTQATLNFQDIEMTCPWCGKTGMYDLANFTSMHARKVSACKCPSCKHTFNADDLSAQYLKTDLQRFIEVQKTGLTCPWCKKRGMYDLSKFTTMYAQIVPICMCPSCKHIFNVDGIIAQKLRKEIQRMVGAEKAWYFPIIRSLRIQVCQRNRCGRNRCQETYLG